MLEDAKFSDLVNIRQLHVRMKPMRSRTNKNFEEFAKVYRDVIADSMADAVALTQNSESIKNTEKCEDLVSNIKTIKIEMPVLGAEQAIVEPPSKHSMSKVSRGSLHSRDGTIATDITKQGSRRLKNNKLDIRKGIAGLSRKYELVEDGVQVDKTFQINVAGIKLRDEHKQEFEFKKEKELIKDTHKLLKQTKQEIDQSSAQLEVIKSMITNIKPPEKPKKPKTSSCKAKKKIDRHADCLNKKYMTTLKTMHEKLRKLEEKYFSKPQVVYKNVRDICTTYSSSNLYEENNSTGTVDINEELKGIEQQLDVFDNSNLVGDEKKIEQREYSEEEYEEEEYEKLEYEPKQYEEEEYKPKQYEEEEYKHKKGKGNKPEDIRELKKTSQKVTLYPPEIEPKTVGDTFDEEKNIMPLNFACKQPADMNEQKSNTSMSYSFKMPTFCDELNNLNCLESNDSDYVRLIDHSEQWFKKNFMGNFDIECFCQELCNFDDEKIQPSSSKDQLAALNPNTTHETDSSESVHRVDSATDRYYHGDSNGFFTKDLQSVISGSVFLSKEFSDVKPNIKVFSNNGRYVQSGNLELRPPLTVTNAVPPSLIDLIDNLSLSLQDSIYYKAG